MLKGDKKRQDILDCAEKLFCMNGYEKTSVQDILDALHTSKGSFYHHFISKQSVLESLSIQKAEESYSITLRQEDTIQDEIGKISFILSGMIPLKGQAFVFLRMLLPTFDLAEGRSVSIGYQDALEEYYLPLLHNACRTAMEAGLITPFYRKEMAAFCLKAVNYCWSDIVKTVLADSKNNRPTVLSDLLQKINMTEGIIQRILELPYGSIRLMDVSQLRLALEKIKY